MKAWSEMTLFFVVIRPATALKLRLGITVLRSTLMKKAMVRGNHIRGVLAPVVTPFKADLSPDSQRFIAHCKWLLSQNCGLAVFGTDGDARRAPH